MQSKGQNSANSGVCLTAAFLVHHPQPRISASRAATIFYRDSCCACPPFCGRPLPPTTAPLATHTTSTTLPAPPAPPAARPATAHDCAASRPHDDDDVDDNVGDTALDSTSISPPLCTPSRHTA
jgi:hypothetical protein